MVPEYGHGDPAVDRNPVWVGAEYIDLDNGGTWVCTDNTTDANVWISGQGMMEADIIALSIALG
jgi:hypothetical protein